MNSSNDAAKQPAAGQPTVAPQPQTGENDAAVATYASRVQSERDFFGGDLSIYELPAIYDYWSNKYLRPVLQRFGLATPIDMYVKYLDEAYVRSPETVRHFVSLGAGDCAAELAICRQLLALGRDDFVFECLDLNSELLAKAAAEATRLGVGERLVTAAGDFNEWAPSRRYDGILANNSLHHVMNLEGVLGGIRRALLPTGTFVTSDMIGRNGHMRWPEALKIVHEYWRELPDAYRRNRLLSREEPLYENWDCSTEGFEGIRAQDILPLLIANFDFDLFIPFGNVIDPFIDRCFGHNFDPGNAWDCAFIDRVQARDEAEIRRGAIKPTHILGALCAGRPGRGAHPEGLTPRFCVRLPDEPPLAWSAPDADPSAPASRDSQTYGVIRSRDYSDLWWNEAEPGWGLSIHHHPSDQLVATWQTYDARGGATWYLLQPGRWIDETTFEGQVYATSMTAPSPAPHGRGPVAVRVAGAATLRFLSRASAVFAYDVDGQSASIAITRMPF